MMAWASGWASGGLIPSGFDGVATGGGQGMKGKKEGCGTCFSIPHERAGWWKDEQNSLSRRRQLLRYLRLPLQKTAIVDHIVLFHDKHDLLDFHDYDY